eukprot:NODE_806_length_4082_cov_0.326638.p4 type:complete len:117 gc:universal NODE_806_length_4082_cov_0.326638:2315-1965(-)
MLSLYTLAFTAVAPPPLPPGGVLPPLPPGGSLPPPPPPGGSLPPLPPGGSVPPPTVPKASTNKAKSPVKSQVPVTKPKISNGLPVAPTGLPFDDSNVYSSSTIVTAFLGYSFIALQ